MKKTKTQKGITLIALIITIVVLLILAVVAINSIQNDGILSHAGNVANTYNQSVKNEEETLQNYLEYLDKANGGSTTVAWTQSGTTVTNGTVTLEVGTTVTGYTSPTGTTDPGWAVLGAENGKLLLVSKANVQDSVTLSGATHLIDADNNGKVDGIDYLDSICDDYLNTSLADSARSITVEDINRVTGYNPAETGDGNPYGNGTIYQYGNEVTYTLTKDDSGAVTGIAWTSATDSNSSTLWKKFMTPDGKRMMSDTDWDAITDKTGLTRVESIEITSNYYNYYPTTLTTSSSGDTKGIAAGSLAYTVLFGNNSSYLLASPYDKAKDFSEHGFRVVSGGKVSVGYYMWYAGFGFNSNNSGGARAVVSLKSNANIDETGKIS